MARATVNYQSTIGLLNEVVSLHCCLKINGFGVVGFPASLRIA